jgi:hypothetical protein
MSSIVIYDKLLKEFLKTISRTTFVYFLSWGNVGGGIDRDTREGWPLLTVDTEVNGDIKRTNERGPFLVGSLGLSCQYKRFSFCLGYSSRPCTKYCFPHCTLFQLLCPHRPASWAGNRAGSPIS